MGQYRLKDANFLPKWLVRRPAGSNIRANSKDLYEYSFGFSPSPQPEDGFLNSQLTAAKSSPHMHKLRCSVWPSEHLNTPLPYQTYLALKSGVYGVLEIKVLNESRGDERVDKRILVGVH